MKIDELQLNRNNFISDVPCETVLPCRFVSTQGFIRPVGENRFRFITNDQAIEFSITDPEARAFVTKNFKANRFALAQITTKPEGKDGKIFYLQIDFFAMLVNWGSVPTVISGNAEKVLKKKKFLKPDAKKDDIAALIKDNFTLSDGIRTFFAFTMGEDAYANFIEADDNQAESREHLSSQSDAGDDSELKDANAPSDPDSKSQRDENDVDEEENETQHAPAYVKQKEDGAPDEQEAAEQKKSGYITIYGRDFCMSGRLAEEGTGIIKNQKLLIEKIGVKKQNIPMMRLFNGELNVTDENAILAKKVRDALMGQSEYLDLWDRYESQEGDNLLARAREVGLINISRDKIEKYGDGVRLPYTGLTPDAEALIDSGCYLYFSDDIPIYLKKTDLSWDGYNEHLKLKEEAAAAADKEFPVTNAVLEKKEKKHDEMRANIRVSDRSEGGIILDCQLHEIPDKPYVSLSIIGDKVQFDRKKDARDRIRDGLAANPTLGLILEGITTEVSTVIPGKKVAPLSPFVEKKIFKNPPTQTQKKAIEIALNTPDIAIIQGPPGTGKTTVITAIIERLNELCDKSQKIEGQVLITSFQHAAVRNVIERLKINSLPTLKFGKQERFGDEDLTKDQAIAEWCDDYIEKLSEKNPELAETQAREQLALKYNYYLIYPSEENALEFLKAAKELTTDPALNVEIDALAQSFNLPEEAVDGRVITLIRRLKTTVKGFEDDGPAHADNLLQKLEDMNIDASLPENKRVIDALDTAALRDAGSADEKLLKDLAWAKDTLLKKCIPKPVYKNDEVDPRISEIYTTVNQSVKVHDDEKSAILADLLKELRANRSEVERALAHYLFVYAATTQQSMGTDIKLAKNIDKDAHPEYETVIVDEAARVSPLDLMIPLSQAKSKIILVGDHRQLPHMYNEEVFESMKSSGEEFDMRSIKKSMFEHLLERAKELEKIDGIQRTIVLDAQYRMHPVLGEYINNTFYRPYGENFGSPLPPEHYAQNLSQKPFPVEWHHLPNSYGNGIKTGTTRKRDCEADFIAEKIREMMYSDNSRTPEGKPLKYGVITFYSGQVRAIKEKLKQVLGEDSEKVRVGSVDAFQGMEYDVIFLSVVRSSWGLPTVLEGVGAVPARIDSVRLADPDDQAYRDMVGIQNYGFLISENRLCVALSRQKRLLIVVGDADMFRGEEWGVMAQACVPGMKGLYDLCESEGVVY